MKSTRKGLTEGDQTTVEIIKELREVLNGKCNISVLSNYVQFNGISHVQIKSIKLPKY